MKRKVLWLGLIVVVFSAMPAKGGSPTMKAVEIFERLMAMAKGEGERVEFCFNFDHDSARIKPVQVFVNGSRFRSRAIKRRAKDKIEDSVIIPLIPGENRIRIWATNGKSETESVLTVFAQKGPAGPAKVPIGRLLVLAIGVGKYEHLSGDQLKYADDDAEAVVAAFEKMEGRLFKEVKKMVLSDSTIKPTSENIIDSLDFLAEAGADDTVILFLAGHGVKDRKGHFYFLPSDAKMEGLLEGKADGNRDGSITIGEVANYVSNRVKVLSGGMQHPAAYIPGDVTMEIYRTH